MTSPLEIIRAAALVVQPLATGDFTWFVRVTTTQPEVCELACSAQSFDSWVGALNAGTLALKALELSATDLRQRTIQPDDLAAGIQQLDQIAGATRTHPARLHAGLPAPPVLTRVQRLRRPATARIFRGM